MPTDKRMTTNFQQTKFSEHLNKRIIAPHSNSFPKTTADKKKNHLLPTDRSIHHYRTRAKRTESAKCTWPRPRMVDFRHFGNLWRLSRPCATQVLISSSRGRTWPGYYNGAAFYDFWELVYACVEVDWIVGVWGRLGKYGSRGWFWMSEVK